MSMATEKKINVWNAIPMQQYIYQNNKRFLQEGALDTLQDIFCLSSNALTSILSIIGPLDKLVTMLDKLPSTCESSPSPDTSVAFAASELRPIRAPTISPTARPSSTRVSVDKFDNIQVGPRTPSPTTIRAPPKPINMASSDVASSIVEPTKPMDINDVIEELHMFSSQSPSQTPTQPRTETPTISRLTLNPIASSRTEVALSQNLRAQSTQPNTSQIILITASVSLPVAAIASVIYARRIRY